MKMFYSCVTIATHRHLGPWFQEMYVRDTLCTCFKICLRFLIQNIKKKSKTSLQTSRWPLSALTVVVVVVLQFCKSKNYFDIVLTSLRLLVVRA